MADFSIAAHKDLFTGRDTTTGFTSTKRRCVKYATTTMSTGSGRDLEKNIQREAGTNANVHEEGTNERQWTLIINASTILK
jgi:hypothetical protein